MTVVEDPVGVRQPLSAKGSIASTKQIAWSVFKGQKVTCKTGEQSVFGYVYGQDDYHWLVVSPNLVMHLVHKSCAIVSIDPDETYATEKNYDALEALVGPFRRWVCDNLLNRPDPMTASIQKDG